MSTFGHVSDVPPLPTKVGYQRDTVAKVENQRRQKSREGRILDVSIAARLHGAATNVSSCFILALEPL